MLDKFVVTVNVLAWTIWALLELWVNIRKKGDSVNSQDKKSSFYLDIFTVSAICSGIIIPKLLPYFSIGTSTFSQILGTCIMFFGIGLRYWAIQTLGKFFRSTVMVQKEHKVITSGPYKYVRHPSYTGSLITFLGAGIALNNWMSLWVMVGFMVIAYVYRIKTEEEALSMSIGDEYCTYKKHTKCLLPFLY